MLSFLYVIYCIYGVIKLGIDLTKTPNYNFSNEHVSTILSTYYQYNIPYYVLNKETQAMTENEIMLINLIRNHEKPDKAFVTAIEIILSFLNHHEASASGSPVVSRELIETVQA